MVPDLVDNALPGVFRSLPLPGKAAGLFLADPCETCRCGILRLGWSPDSVDQECGWSVPGSGCLSCVCASDVFTCQADFVVYQFVARVLVTTGRVLRRRSWPWSGRCRVAIAIRVRAFLIVCRFAKLSTNNGMVVIRYQT